MKTLKLTKTRKLILKNIKDYTAEKKEAVKKCKSIDDVFANWFLTKFLTKTTSNKKYWENKNLSDIKNYLFDRIDKIAEKRKAEEISNFENILNSGKLIECTIIVNWKKNRTWVSNPTAEARYSYIDNNGNKRYNSVYGSSIGSCGYDKKSTAVAEVLNMIEPIKLALYRKKNANINKSNREIFSYGIGGNVLPSVSGGVGVSCYPSCFKQIGYKFENIAYGKMSDVYKITKI